MKTLATVFLALTLVIPAMAQQTDQTFITGGGNIRFDTRTQLDGNNPKAGITDRYTLQFNVSNSALFRGDILALPYIDNTFSDQQGSLTFNMECDVVNPKNPSQTKNVGKLFGTVPVDAENVYHFATGNARVSVLGLGNAKGFESKFGGIARGKPPVKKGFFQKIKKEAISFGRQVKGQKVVVVVQNYDMMGFQNHVIPAGPVQIYPEATVNGNLVYDYARESWFFQNVTIVYALDGKQMIDKLSGNIRWVEPKDGEGEYQFDVRINEPPPSETDAFASASDESAFFETDDSNPSLTGTMKYKDSLAGETVVASAITIDLKGNKLTKQQTMNLAKLLLISTVVPLNSE